MSTRSRHATRLSAAVLALLLVPAAGGAQTVVERARLGHGLEEIAYIDSGPHAGSVAFLDGYEVFLAPLAGQGAPHKLFDLRDVGSPGHSQGLAWIASERLFALVSGAEPGLLRLVDAQGRPAGTRALVFPGPPATALEGIDHVPADSPVYPDHLVLSSATGGSVLVARRDGQVVTEIVPAPPAQGYLLGLAYLPPDRLLVSILGNEVRANRVYTLDFSGNVVAGPAVVANADSLEGLDVARDGSILAGDFHQGSVAVLDPATLAPVDERRNDFGIGVSFPRGLAWDGAEQRHLVSATAAQQGFNVLPVPVFAVSADLRRAQPFSYPSQCGYPNTHRMTYIGAERHGVIVSQNAPRALVVMEEDGSVIETIDLGPLGFGRVRSAAWVPATNGFAVRFLDDPMGPTTLRLVTRTGALAGTRDLAATGLTGIGALTATHAGDGLVVAGGPSRVVEVDLAGALVAAYDLRSTLDVLSVGDLSTIDSGPQAGSYGLIDSINAELVVFRLP